MSSQFRLRCLWGLKKLCSVLEEAVHVQREDTSGAIKNESRTCISNKLEKQEILSAGSKSSGNCKSTFTCSQGKTEGM